MGIRDFFRKKDDAVIDFSDLQKRGIIKQRKAVKEQISGSFVDLTGNKNSQENPLSFLGALAGASGNNLSETSETEVSSTDFAHERKQKLKGIIRDMKAKIDTTSNKIYKLSDRLDLLEKKLERLERRAGYGA